VDDRRQKTSRARLRELRFESWLRYGTAIGTMITPEVLTEYIRRMLPDAQVAVRDRTGTMDHLAVRVISDHFKDKNLLDRHRMIYQALDVPMKDGRIHALELTAETPDGA